MATKFGMTRDINGYNGFGIPFADDKFSAVLGTSIDTTLIIPSNMGMGGNGIYQNSVWLAIFEFTPGSDVFVSLNETAQIPAGASFASTSSDQNPAARLVQGGDVLHFFSAGTNVNVTVLLYSIS